MAGLEHDLCFDQYEQCRTLYEQDKYTECTHLGLQNMKDHNMPRYLQIKTLILLVGAENDSWHKAEVGDGLHSIHQQLIVANNGSRATDSVLRRCMP